MKLTYLGHSGFLIETGKHRLVFDPFIRGNELAQGKVDVDQLKPDYILVSHGHEDHTADLVYLATQSGATVIANWEIHSWLNKQGIDQTHPMNIGGSWNFPFGRVKMFQAVHSSSFADGTYAGNPGGFILELEEGITFYYSGDTGLFLDMQLIPKFHRLDFCIFPIGDNFTMDCEQAVMASDFVECEKVIGMHFDTFGYIKIDHQAVQDTFRKAGKELILPEIGKTIEL